ncbi:MAG: segregation/condensation protein A [Mollicutes bacterium]|nr:segregation/condensation protein A [Mollicutes bacterium]
MQLTFTIKDFEGPLDLLLHLVKASKMDLYNIDIALITKEYLNFINNNDGLSIDASSEYLVMASELVHLKSKLLLNKNEETEEDEYEFNNPDELSRRLLEYQKIKDITKNFKELEEKRKEVYTKIPSYLEEYQERKLINSNVGLEDLLNAFESFLKRQKLSEPVDTRITKKELSVEERIVNIKKTLKDKKGKIKFLELFDDISKPYVIVTFLAILNMAKNNDIKIIQQNNFSDIYIESCDQK